MAQVKIDRTDFGGKNQEGQAARYTPQDENKELLSKTRTELVVEMLDEGLPMKEALDKVRGMPQYRVRHRDVKTGAPLTFEALFCDLQKAKETEDSSFRVARLQGDFFESYMGRVKIGAAIEIDDMVTRRKIV
jgi:hypothetical protein